MIDAHSLGWALIHSLWQGTLLALALALLLAMCRTSPATHRYALAAGALVLMIVLPLAALLTQTAPRSPSGEPVAPELPSQRSVSTTPPPEGPSKQHEASSRLPSIHATLPWIVRAWYLGVAALSLFHMGGLIRVRRLRSMGASQIGPALGEQASNLERRLGLKRKVELLRSTRVLVPTVVGSYGPWSCSRSLP